MPDGRSKEDLDAAIRQIVSQAILPNGIVDIYNAAGIKNPKISILSEEFLDDVRGLPHRNLVQELLKKLLNDEIKTVSRRNLIQSRSFAQMLDQSSTSITIAPEKRLRSLKNSSSWPMI